MKIYFLINYIPLIILKSHKIIWKTPLNSLEWIIDHEIFIPNKIEQSSKLCGIRDALKYKLQTLNIKLIFPWNTDQRNAKLFTVIWLSLSHH